MAPSLLRADAAVRTLSAIGQGTNRVILSSNTMERI